MKFSDIKQFPRSTYEVDVSWVGLEEQIGQWNVDLDPDFQRGHVWSQTQRTAYIEYCLKGGDVSRNLIFNCPTWRQGGTDKLVILDGKQRLQSVRWFLADRVKAFGLFYSEFEDDLPWISISFRLKVLELKTQQEILDLYLSINTGGSRHTPEEINRVKKLREAAREFGKPRIGKTGEN